MQKTVEAYFRKSVVAGAIALTVASSGASAQLASTKPRPIRDEATFQLALTMKVRADQSFLLGDRTEAAGLYDSAAKEIKALGSEWAAENDTLLALLDADIAYRQSLLRYDADFWGATFSLTPINPVDAYLRFEEAVDKLDELVVQIHQEQAALTSATALGNAWRAAAAGAQTESEAQALEQIADKIKEDNHGAKATAAQDRIDQNIRRQKDIADERKDLAAQYDAAHKKFDSLVVNAALQTAGIPPELKELANSDKPLEQRILSAGRAAIASNSGLANSFSQFSEATASVVEAARTVEKAVSEVERLDRMRKSADAAVAALRKGTLEGALEAGSIVYAQLPEEDKGKLKAYVLDKGKPAMALFETARNVQSTLKVVVATVKGDPQMLGKFKNMITERALDNAPALDRWYRTQLEEAAKLALTTGNGRALMEQAIRAWPRAFYAKLPQDMRDELRTALNVASEAQAAANVFGTWPPSDRVQMEVEGVAVVVKLGTKTGRIDLRQFIATQQQYSMEALQDYAQAAVDKGVGVARADVQKRLGSMINTALDSHEALAQSIIGNVQDADPASSLSRLVPSLSNGAPDPAASAQLFDAVWQKLPPEAKELSSAQLAAVQAGSMIGRDVVSAAQRVPTGNPSFKGSDTSGKAEEAILKAAVAMAFPAAGAAIMAVEALQAVGEMNSLADRINTLTAEDRRVMAEQITLFDLVRDERAAVALAELGGRIAERRRVGALAQASHYADASKQLDEATIRSVGAQRLYLPRTFLLAEQLRFHFDRLDRSLAFWTGDSRASRGQIAREITSDPQWLRYALDPSIQLFSWLDRSGETDRGNLSKLVSDWQQKLILASSVCDRLQCKKTNAVVGEVTTSPEISMKAAVPDQWAKFERWKATGGAAFTFELLVTPQILQPAQTMHNLRFVSARVGGERGGEVKGLQGVRLEHSGAAYVPYEDTYIKEHYLPRTAYGVDWSAFGGLRTRWQTTLSLMPLEGYGLYTLWRLVLPDSSEARGATDVKLQFGMQFQDRTVVRDDSSLLAEEARKKAWGFVMKTADNVPVRVRLSDLPFFTTEAAARKAVDAMAKEADAGKLGLAGVELKEAKGGQQ